MDLSVNHNVMGVQKRYDTECGNHVFKLQEAFKETDIKGNNNFLNSLKTETNSDHGHDPSSVFQVNCAKEKDFEVDSSLFNYSSFKKAMDLRIHNRTVDGGKRTIFDDAEYFARNCCYKLLPITFEQVDETIIHTEHNYSLFSLNSESETEEDCSRTMDYSQIKEKNYKKRRTKLEDSSDQEELDVGKNGRDDFISIAPQSNDDFPPQPVTQNLSLSPEEENSLASQPLDLSAAPVVQEEKTEPHARERPTRIFEKAACGNEEVAQPDSDKENVSGELSGIQVTITRPDEKENYQPCDLFLNDIARLVPWLIDKDCFEVDILDRTCDRLDEFRKHRLYYVISESTWRSFQSTNDRVILTNDHSLGTPLQKEKKEKEKEERPTFLVFDQFSLAKCLAEYCQQIGGCFEYTCVEEGQQDAESPKEKSELIAEDTEEEKKDAEEEEKEKVEGEEKNAEPIQGLEVGTDEVKNRVKVEKETENDANEIEEEVGTVVTEVEPVVRTEKSVGEAIVEEVSKNVGEVEENNTEKGGKESSIDVKEASQKSELTKETTEKPEGAPATFPELQNKSNRRMDEAERRFANAEVSLRLEQMHPVPEKKDAKPEKRGTKRRNKPPMQPKVKNSRITTRSKCTSESEASQTSDKRVKRKREEFPPPKPEEPPKKRKRRPKSENNNSGRKSTKSVAQDKAPRLPTSKKPEKKENGTQKQMEKRERRARGKKVEGKKRVQQATGRSLRSHKGMARVKAEAKANPKPVRARKR